MSTNAKEVLNRINTLFNLVYLKKFYTIIKFIFWVVSVIIFFYKVYVNVNYIYYLLIYFFIYKMFTSHLIFNKLNQLFNSKNLLLILLTIILCYLTALNISYILKILISVNLNLATNNFLILNSEDLIVNTNDSIFLSESSNTNSSTNSNQNNRIISFQRISDGFSLTALIPADSLFELGLGIGAGIGSVRGMATVAKSVIDSSPNLPIAGKILTSMGLMVLGSGGILYSTRVANDLVRNKKEANFTCAVKEVVKGDGNSTPNSEGVTDIIGTWTTNNSSNNNNNMTIELNSDLISNLIYSGDLIASPSIEVSSLESLIYNNLNIDIVILLLKLMLLNIFIIRFFFTKFKNQLTNIRILNNKIFNVTNIINNVLIYNYNFYNLLIKINICLIFTFKLFITIVMAWSYYNLLDLVMGYYFKQNKLSIDDKIVITFINELKKSGIENLFLIIDSINIILILILLYLIYIFYIKKKINTIVIVFLTIYLLLFAIDLNLFLELNSNLNFYVKEYISLHIQI